jgi:hypothetical protein
MVEFKRVLLGALLVLGGCGGGSGNAPATTGSSAKQASYAFASPYAQFVSAVSTTNLTVSGACSGTATSNISAPVSMTFQGTSALAATQTIEFSNCSSLESTRTIYYNDQMQQVGFSISGGEFGVAQAPLNMPTQVSAGSSGDIGAFNVWTDSTMSVPNGTLTVSYTVQALSSTSVLVVITKQSFGPAGALFQTENYEYAVNAQGMLSVDAFDYVTANVLITAS